MLLMLNQLSEFALTVLHSVGGPGFWILPFTVIPGFVFRFGTFACSFLGCLTLFRIE